MATISLRQRPQDPRAAWRALPQQTRRRAILAIEIAILLALLPFYTALAILLAGILLLTQVPERAPLPWLLGRPRSLALPLGILVIAVLYPKYLGAGGFPFYGKFGIPILKTFPSVDTGVVMLVFIMMAIGLNMVVGYAGLLDLGYVAFYAMGAYTAAWFASPQFAKYAKHGLDFGAAGTTPNSPGFHFNVWLVLLMAGISTAIIGVIIGLPTLRLRGDYLAIVTLGFGEIMPQIARNGDNLFNTGFNLTNGASGISPIDGPGFGNAVHRHVNFLPSNFFNSGNPTELFFWGGIVLVLFTVFCSWRLRDSRLGRAWIAIREDEIAAAAMGIPLMRTKTWAYAAGAS